MITVNLLPWRENKRQNIKKEITKIIITLLIGTFSLSLLIKTHIQKYIKMQENNHKIIYNEILKCEQKIKEILQIKKAQQLLINKMSILEKNDNVLTSTPKILHNIINILAKYIHLYRIQRIKNKIILTGEINNPNKISFLLSLLRKIPQIEQIKTFEILKNLTDKKTSNSCFKTTLLIQ